MIIVPSFPVVNVFLISQFIIAIDNFKKKWCSLTLSNKDEIRECHFFMKQLFSALYVRLLPISSIPSVPNKK